MKITLISVNVKTNKNWRKEVYAGKPIAYKFMKDEESYLQ